MALIEMSHREPLPNRRMSQTLKFKAQGTSWFATIGCYPDGRIGELFLSASKTGSDLSIATRDSAIAVSSALQCGARVSELAAAMSKNAQGHPEGPLGRVLYELIPLEKELMEWAADARINRAADADELAGGPPSSGENIENGKDGRQEPEQPQGGEEK